MNPSVNIVIPTYNRGRLIGQAVEAALAQTHPETQVTVIDDASTDDTREALRRFEDHPRYCGVYLRGNLGTANAKNVGILLNPADAVTFHDSDDVPHRDKLIRQARVLGNERVRAHPILNWKLCGVEPSAKLPVSAALCHHTIIMPDGDEVEIGRDLSLVDDVFPNLQMGSSVPGEWTHINTGLFRAEVFRDLGGFSDCIEEDREFRNRLLLAGRVFWVIRTPLFTKIETPDSLTQSGESDYDSPQRLADRAEVWRKVEHWMATREVEPEPITIPGLDIARITHPERLSLSGALATEPTRAAARAALAPSAAAA